MKQAGIKLLALAAFLLSLASCDSTIYDDEGDCDVTYRLKFRYDYNMKFADAFANEVKSVHVYAFDADGTLVWQKSEKGDALAADDYSMTLDMPAGDYQLIAWCGLENDGTRGESFTVPEMTVGTSKIEELQCKLNRNRDADGNAYSDTDLYALFHGTLDVSLPEAEYDGGEYVYTMPLVKDTNHLRVILQHLSGEDVDVTKFTFTLEDDNGFMAYDNSLIADESITYKTWNTETGSAGVDTEEGVQTSVKVAIADLTVPRLIDGHKMYLTIRNDEGEVVVRVPFIDYAVLVKGYYNREMSDQEYLDRQDEYSMTFFLDGHDQWISSSILINAWRVVLSNVDIK